MSGIVTVTVNPEDIEGVKRILAGLNTTETNKVLSSTINTTMTGVVTDGTKILYDHYALPSSVIKEAWSINKANYAAPNGRVFCQGEFIRLKEFGATKNSTGVSVKILRTGTRETVPHAFLAQLGYKMGVQVYRRKYNGPRTKASPKLPWKKMGYNYRFPVKALYGPRIQDYLGDPERFNLLSEKADDRLLKEMERRVDALLRGF